MKRPNYDSVEGIRQEYLKDLDGLNRLIQDRIDAYKRGERLQEFCILGHWIADTCGNFGKIIEPKKGFNIGGVVYKDDLKGRIGYTFVSDVPSENMPCAYCGKHWTIDDCYDTFVKDKTKSIDLEEFVGKTLGDVRKIFKEKTDAKYFMLSEDLCDSIIRNDKYIDENPVPGEPIGKDKWRPKINEKGWVPNIYQPEIKITDDHIIEKGDFGFFYTYTYYHNDCHRRQQAEEDSKYYCLIFKEAGFKEFSMEEIPNGYCPCEYCGPWYKVYTFLGPISIGWRKRVINIDWSNTIIKDKEIFKDEKVTQGSEYIHAWGKDKAVEYLSKLREIYKQ